MAVMTGDAADIHPVDRRLRASVVVLTLATAAIDALLGGMLFMANAAGYVGPGPGDGRPRARRAIRWLDPARAHRLHRGDHRRLGRLRTVVRPGLPRQGDRGRADGVLPIEQWRSDGGPVGVYRRVRGLLHGMAAQRSRGTRASDSR